jgi:DNA-binding transcriptional ArsR family regulator
MVEYTLSLDTIFSSLADPTRRDILKRVSRKSLTISEIAKHYHLTFAAVSKHLKVLEKAELVTKQRKGKEQMVHIAPQALVAAEDYLEQYRALWEDRFDRLETLLKKESN